MIIVNLHHVALILDAHTRAHTHQLGSISLLFFASLLGFNDACLSGRK